ncbi:MAG: 6,7-dimethyl-8-ribityllumazine synthase [Saprospiraceae bacterium]|nr:6,7-dimethyl-8-ribityllumazine synthase [Saprospiraceae bacterium]
MGGKKTNLSQYKLDETATKEVKIGVVTSEWNSEVTQQLLSGCKETLTSEGIPEDNLYFIQVPGAFELPVGARILDDKYNLDAVICLGCVVKGETKHDEYINLAVAQGLMQLSVLRSKPFVFGLLTTNDMDQAKDRAGGSRGNKGVEAAATALQMIQIKKELKSASRTIGF